MPAVNSSCLQMVKILSGLIFLLVAALSPSCASIPTRHFNVIDYGAKGNGVTDDSTAFLNAWAAACNSSVLELPTLVVPLKSFLLNPVVFQGPCIASKINFLIFGTILAPASASFWDGHDANQWMAFEAVNGLSVYGFGKATIDGRGKNWWDRSCRDHPKLKNCTEQAPTIMNFLSCNATAVSNLVLKNSGRVHIVVYGCNNFTAKNLLIQSPGDSPYTDGFHIQASHHIFITNSSIGSGDDCISIGDFTSDVQVANVQCGPGHGISIGSLGRSGNYVQVEKIHISNSTFNLTSNGARIKTWQAGRGYVRDVTFQNLIFHSVDNPIIIDQYYFCNVNNGCRELETGVEISNVTFREINGTTSSEVAINLKCDKSVPCHGMTMEAIHLNPSEKGKKIKANCSNAYGHEKDVLPGPKCLLP